MKNLIIYYSRKGQNYVNGSIVDLKIGQTEQLVQLIQKNFDTDVFKVETIYPYSEDYQKCTEEAKIEKNNNVKPKLVKYINDVKNYDNIIIAGPCWWGTYPMAIFSLLDQLNIKNKKVYPIMTHEGSGLGNVVNDLNKYSDFVQKGLAIRGSQVQQSQNLIINYIKEII